MMDLPDNSPELLADDLRNLRMLNRYLSGSRSVMLGLQRALGREPLKQISVLDVGTGSADIPAAIFAWAKRRNIAAKIVDLLKQWAKLARRGIVISDLVRHPVAYHGIRLPRAAFDE